LFTYNLDIRSWYNEVTKNSIQLGGGHNAIIKTKYKNDPEFQWNIVNCDDFKELPKSHEPGHDNDSGEKGNRDIRDHDDEDEDEEDEDDDEEETRHHEREISDEKHDEESADKEEEKPSKQ